MLISKSYILLLFVAVSIQTNFEDSNIFTTNIRFTDVWIVIAKRGFNLGDSIIVKT
jgi:hypothetical protein